MLLDLVLILIRSVFNASIVELIDYIVYTKTYLDTGRPRSRYYGA